MAAVGSGPFLFPGEERYPTVGLAPGSLIRLDIVAAHTPTEQIGINSMWFLVGNVVSGGLTLEQICDQMRINVEAVWGNWNNVNVGLLGVRGYWINLATGKAIEGAKSASTLVGDLDDGILPSQVSVVVKKKTSTVGRGKHGRLYLPFPVATAVLDNGELDGATEAIMVAYCNTAFSASVLNVGGISSQILPVVAHYGPPVTYSNILSYEATHKFGTQRRRGDYGRTNPPAI